MDVSEFLWSQDAGKYFANGVPIGSTSTITTTNVIDADDEADANTDAAADNTQSIEWSSSSSRN